MMFQFMMLETKKTLIAEKDYRDLIIYFVKKHLMTDNHMVHRVLNKIKIIIDIEKFDDTKMLIDTNYKLTDEGTLKNVVKLIWCKIKDKISGS